MKTTLTFDVSIRAPRARVWDTLLTPDGYRAWTGAFREGSHYEGSWEQGETIRFLDPDGNGLLGFVRGNQRHELISIEHLGVIEKGVENRGLPGAPFYEDYRLADEDGGTALQVSVDVRPEHEAFMEAAFPKALATLKRLCEARAPGRPEPDGE